MTNSIDILNELTAISTVIAGIKKVNVFTVPAGYFEGLAQTVAGKINFEEHLQPANLTKTEQANYTVPQGYFESLADNILSKIKTEGSTTSAVLSNITKANVYTVPHGYFNTVADNMLHKIKAKADTAYPVLSNISKENVYAVPQGYFETLTKNILSAATQQQAKVVAITKRSNWLKYAVAAAFTGVIAMGAYQFIGKTKTEVLPNYVQAGMQIKNVEAELEKVTEDDIIKYLQANGSDVDAALVASTVDENELPTQDDYLMDDKALDKYLDNIDLNDLKN